MHLIPCPYCGVRMEHEFTYGGDATVRLPGADAGEAAHFDFVYMRENPWGAHWEWWQHSSGCRAWIKVQRDTGTHEILGVVAADVATPEPENVE